VQDVVDPNFPVMRYETVHDPILRKTPIILLNSVTTNTLGKPIIFLVCVLENQL